MNRELRPNQFPIFEDGPCALCGFTATATLSQNEAARGFGEHVRWHRFQAGTPELKQDFRRVEVTAGGLLQRVSA